MGQMLKAFDSERYGMRLRILVVLLQKGRFSTAYVPRHLPWQNWMKRLMLILRLMAMSLQRIGHSAKSLYLVQLVKAQAMSPAWYHGVRRVGIGLLLRMMESSSSCEIRILRR